MSPSASLFTCFAIAGGLSDGPVGASLGKHIAEALLKEEGAKVVRIFGRKGSSQTTAAQSLSLLGATVLEVDYDSHASLALALEGVDVVISTLAGTQGNVAQIPLAGAAKQAGVQLYIPSLFATSEFGYVIPPDMPLSSLYYGRVPTFAALQKTGIPLLRVAIGHFSDWISDSVFVSPASNAIEIIGAGLSEVSFTSREDTSRFLAHILTHLSPSRLLSLHTLALEGSAATLLHLAQVLQAHTEPRPEIVHVSHDEARARGKRGEFEALNRLDWDLGEARSFDVRTGGKEQLGNGLWKGWVPKGVEEFVREGPRGDRKKEGKGAYGRGDF